MNKRHIRQAEDHLIVSTTTPRTFIDTYAADLRRRHRKSYAPLGIAHDALEEGLRRGQACIFTATSRVTGEVDAAVASLWDEVNYYYWMTTRRIHVRPVHNSTEYPDGAWQRSWDDNAGGAGSGTRQMTNDLVDDSYWPLVQPLGNLVILCARAEASLFDLVAVLAGVDERQAQAVLKQPDAKGQVLTLVRDRSGFQGGELTELVEGIENYWTDRGHRNRYYHDEWHLFLTGSGTAATRGLPSHKGSQIVFDNLTVEEIWALAARFREHDDLFTHAAYVVLRSRPE